MNSRGSDCGGGDSGDGGGTMNPAGGQHQDGIQSTLQSIAQTVGQMQETMMTMIRKMERTDEAVRGVERRLTEQGEIVQKIGNRMNVLDKTLQTRDPGNETESRFSMSTPAAADSTAGSANPALSQTYRVPPPSPCPPVSAPTPPPVAALPCRTPSLPSAVFPPRTRQPSPVTPSQHRSPSHSRQSSSPCLTPVLSPTRPRHSASPPYSPPRSPRISPPRSPRISPPRSPRFSPPRSSLISRKSSPPCSLQSGQPTISMSSPTSAFTSSTASGGGLPSPYDIRIVDSDSSTSSSSYTSDDSFLSDDACPRKLLHSESSDVSSMRVVRNLSPPRSDLSIFSPSTGGSSRSPRPATPISVVCLPPVVPRAALCNTRSASTSPSRPSAGVRSASSTSSHSTSRSPPKSFYSSRSESTPDQAICFCSPPARSMSFSGATYCTIQFPSQTRVRNPSKPGVARAGTPALMVNASQQYGQRARSPGRGRGTRRTRSPCTQSPSQSPSRSPSRCGNPPVGSGSNQSFVEQTAGCAPVRTLAPPVTPPSFGCAEEYATRCAQLARFLLAASHEGKLDKVVSLLDAGADVNCANSLKWTPLHKAAAKAHAEVVAILLQRGADVHAATSYGFTALHMAAYNDRSGKCISHLLQAGSNFDCGNRSGRTPLHSAVECGNVAAMLAILAAGANKSLKDEDGRTAFEMAKTPSVKRLLRAVGRGRGVRTKSKAKDVRDVMVAAETPGPNRRPGNDST